MDKTFKNGLHNQPEAKTPTCKTFFEDYQNNLRNITLC